MNEPVTKAASAPWVKAHAEVLEVARASCVASHARASASTGLRYASIEPLGAESAEDARKPVQRKDIAQATFRWFVSSKRTSGSLPRATEGESRQRARSFSATLGAVSSGSAAPRSSSRAPALTGVGPASPLRAVGHRGAGVRAW